MTLFEISLTGAMVVAVAYLALVNHIINRQEADDRRTGAKRRLLTEMARHPSGGERGGT